MSDDPIKIHSIEVNPPKEALIQTRAEELGLCRGLRVETTVGQWRCGECCQMQPGGSEMVWVPDGVQKGDPDWSVTEACRVGAYNGSSTAWCVGCAPKTVNKKISPPELKPRKQGWFSRLTERLSF